MTLGAGKDLTLGASDGCATLKFTTVEADIYTYYLFGAYGYSTKIYPSWEPGITTQTNSTSDRVVYSGYPKTGSLSANTAYTITLQNTQSTAANFSVIVVAGSGTEGTRASPVKLTVGTTRNATIGYGPAFDLAYYYFTTGSAGTYTVKATNISSPAPSIRKPSITYKLFSDSSFATAIGDMCGPAAGTATSILEGEGVNRSCAFGGLSANTTYYLQVKEYNTYGFATYGTFDLLVSAP